MKNITAAQFESGLKDRSISVLEYLPGATGVIFLGSQVGNDEILFRVTGL